MKLLTLTSAALAVAHPLAAQGGLAPVPGIISTLTTLPPGDDVLGGPVGSAGRLVYYSTRTAINAYDRVTKRTTVVASGRYDDLAVSAAGDRLAMVRGAENAKPGTKDPGYVWTIPVNPQSGRAIGEPRRVSVLAGESPAISPDGKLIAFIATQPTHRLVVVPFGGGTERVLVDHVASDNGSPLGAVRWSSDGRSIFFFAAAAGGGPAQGALSRVSAAGGTPVSVGIGGVIALPPPDGQHYLAASLFSESGATVDIFDQDKKLLGRTSLTFDTATGFPCNFGWSGKGMNLLMAMYKEGSALHAQAVPSGPDRTITMSDLFGDAALSPDGKHLAIRTVVDAAKVKWGFSIADADGRNPRAVQTPEAADPGQRFVWSPDGTHVAFRTNDRRSLYVADVATGKAVKVGSADFHIYEVRWRADSRSLMFVRYDGTDTRSKVSVHESTLDGRDRLVRDLSPMMPAEGERWYSITNFFGDSAVLAVNLGLRIPLYGGSAERMFDPIKMLDPIKNPGVNTDVASKPGRSDDGRWIAVPSADKRSYQVISSDEQFHRTVTLPPGVMPIDEAFFGPDNQALILPTKETSSSGPAVYLVPVDGGSAHALVQLAPGERLDDVYLSRDRTTLMYVRHGRTTITLVEADLGVALKVRAPAKEE